LNNIKNLISKLSAETSIIGKERYLNSAVLIPIVVMNDKEFILFEKRSTSVRQPGEISFPGGHFDEKFDADFLSTAIRETSEELGITSEKINVLGKLGTLVAPMGVIVETYVGILNIQNISELYIDQNEVERIFLIPLKHFLDTEPEHFYIKLEIHPYTVFENGEKQELLPVKELGLPEKYSYPWNTEKHRVIVYRTNEEVIWGITAELIYDLSKKIKKNNE
jgi:8-oxo-dGTP pyrophosphatase MutT (NUDIX family)